MSKSKNKSNRKKRNRQAFEVSTPVEENSASDVNSSPAGSGPRWQLIAIFVIIAIGGTYLAKASRDSLVDVPRYTYKEIYKYPHDSSSFTQGLLLEDGIVWESTGKNGQSSIRKVDLKTGETLNIKKLEDRLFGEGLAMVGDKLYQLTWQNETCLVYDRDLTKLKEFKYDGQGWGLTYDGTHLIMSDGTSRLRFIDPETFDEVRSVYVRKGSQAIGRLNELEFADGYVYANRLDWDSIYKIDPKDGQLKGIIDLGGIWPREQRPREGVLNGIAVDAEKRMVIVTGKYCPYIYEVEFLPVQ